MKMEFQTESAECGLACIAMIASHYGSRLGVRDYREKYGISLKGATLSKLIAVAKQIGFDTKAIRVELEDLISLEMPAILHWNLDHFVVLSAVTSSKLTILDPAFGERKISLAEASKYFTGVVLELSPTTDFSDTEEPETVTLRQLTGPMPGLRRGLLQIFILSAALQFTLLLAPFQMQWIVDQVLVAADASLIAVIAAAFSLLIAFQIICAFLRGWSVAYLSNKVGLKWSDNIFSHLIRLPLDFYEKRHLGDVISRLGSVSQVQRVLTTGFVEAVVDGFMASATLILMVIYSWKLALVTVLITLLYLATRIALYSSFKEHSHRALIAEAKQLSYLMESIRGIQSLKIGGRESSRRGVNRILLKDSAAREFVIAKFQVYFDAASQLLFGFERVAAISLGALIAIQGDFSVGMLIAYLAYKEQFSQKVASLIDKSVELRMLRLHFERLADIVLTETELDRSAGKRPLPNDLELSLEGISFAYAPGDPNVFSDCSFTIRYGESVAIVGPSGCGKSTLMKVMLGLLQPTSGRVTIGGVSLSDIDQSAYRASVGVVMQSDQLFAGSIAENIAFGEDDIDMILVEQSARMASIHDEISGMPMNYLSFVGDMGAALSGGQRQRIILARALYRQPKILFLDEATSHLDVHRESLVSAQISDLKITRIIIAHRPETIASADRVIVMRDGSTVAADYAQSLAVAS